MAGALYLAAPGAQSFALLNSNLKEYVNFATSLASDGRGDLYLVDQYGAQFFPELRIERATAKIFRAKGCGRCSMTGYRGRTGIHELLVANPEVRKAISRRKTADEIAEMAIEQGMRTLYQDGIAKIFKGDIDILQLQKVTLAE